MAGPACAGPATSKVAIQSLQQIESLDLPDLAPYRTMRLEHDHLANRIFVAEGEKVVRRLLESNLEVLSVLLPNRWFDQFRPLIESRAEPIKVFTAEKKVLEHLTGFTMYQGLLAVARMPEPLPLEVAHQRSLHPRLWVGMDGLANAENVGAIVRNCAAFNAQALLVGETSASPFLRRAVRSSMGTVLRLQVVETHDIVAALRQLGKMGVRCIAAHPHAGGPTLARADLRDDCCIVFGSEGKGLSEATLAACHEHVAIPMPAHVDSLNVASAVAVFLFEANRQRGRV